MSDRMAWGKFSWDAWENDPGLALCSMGAQGFWMRLLCIAAKANGHVLIGDQAPTEADLAMLVRASLPDVIQWLGELEAKRVFSRTGRGVIYSRRMVRACKNRDNGFRGGNPMLLNEKEKPNPVIAESETESEREKKEPNGSVGSDDFQAAWKVYPDRGRTRSSRAKSKPAWTKAAKAAGGDGLLRQAVEAFAESPDAKRDGGEYVPAFDRWLRDGRWEHWLPQQPDLLSPIPVLDPWRFRCQTFLRNDWWEEDWGPRPGREGCKAPLDLLNEFGIAQGHPDLLRRKALHAATAH